MSLLLNGWTTSSPLSIFPKKISPFSSQLFCVSSRLLVLSVMDNTKSNPAKELQSEDGSHAMFSISQPSTLANKKRKSILSSHILQKNSDSITFQWAPFPVEVIGVSAMVPSPSGTKLLIIRNPEDGSPTHFKIWGPSNMKDFVVARSVHGSVYTDGWFEGMSWNSDETAVAYVAEESNPPKPTFSNFGFKTKGTWRRNAVTGRVKVIGKRIGEKLTPAKVVSPDGKYLIFLSAKSSVDSGAHSASDSLHKIDWPSDGKLGPHRLKIVDVVPVVMCPEDGCFPGPYCSKFLSEPWLSDGQTIILSSFWCSVQAILSVNILSGRVSLISPNSSNFSWDVHALDGDNIIAVCSSVIDVPQIKYGSLIHKTSTDAKWNWLDVFIPIAK